MHWGEALGRLSTTSRKVEHCCASVNECKHTNRNRYYGYALYSLHNGHCDNSDFTQGNWGSGVKLVRSQQSNHSVKLKYFQWKDLYTFQGLDLLNTAAKWGKVEGISFRYLSHFNWTIWIALSGSCLLHHVLYSLVIFFLLVWKKFCS